MEANNKIWFYLPNEQAYEQVDGLLWIQSSTICSFENTIQASVDSFNENISWSEMWDLETAKERLSKGHNLFIGVDSEGPLAHIWFQDNYLYNLFINPRRPDGYGEKFVRSCLNFIPYHTISLYVDSWNIRAQKFFKKVGAKKIYSYI